MHPKSFIVHTLSVKYAWSLYLAPVNLNNWNLGVVSLRRARKSNVIREAGTGRKEMVYTFFKSKVLHTKCCSVKAGLLYWVSTSVGGRWKDNALYIKKLEWDLMLTLEDFCKFEVSTAVTKCGYFYHQNVHQISANLKCRLLSPNVVIFTTKMSIKLWDSWTTAATTVRMFLSALRLRGL